MKQPITLRQAAVLVLLSDGPTGLPVLLTKRAPDLGDYPGQLVFPGGASEPSDDSPAATALQEAAEEVGLEPSTVHIIGSLAPFALPDSGFLVTPVLAGAEFAGAPNPAEVVTVSVLPLCELAGRPSRARYPSLMLPSQIWEHSAR